MAATPGQPFDATDPIEAIEQELQSLAGQLQTVQDSLHHAHRLATLGTLATMVAHEYHNLLTPVITYAQMALANPQDASLTQKALQKALEGAQQAAKVSAAVLGFAQVTDDNAQAWLPEVVEDALTCLARPAKRDAIHVELAVPAVMVAISPLSLKQVLVNLLLNARKAMARQGGTLTLQGQVHDNTLHLIVQDTGPGIPESIRQTLFEPFVHCPLQDADAPDQSGTGLGLNICRQLITRAGGHIEAEATQGPGATFHLQLPLATEGSVKT